MLWWSLLFLFVFSFVSCYGDNNNLLFPPQVISVTSNSSCLPNTPLSCAGDTENDYCPNGNHPSLTVDSNASSVWYSSTVENNVTVELTYHFDKFYEVRLITVHFPSVPSYWSINYLINGSYIPIVAIVTEGACLSETLVCIEEDSVNEIDVFHRLSSIGLQAAKYKTDSIRLDFIEPPARNECYYAVSEVSFTVLCSDDNCSEKRRNRFYRETLPLGDSTTRLLWEQKGVVNGLGIWYLDNIQTNDSMTSLEGDGKVRVVPCGSELVTLFSGDGNRSASLQIQASLNRVTFDLGFVTPGTQCARDMLFPPVYMYTCNGEGSCHLEKIYSLEEECGQCTSDSLLRLYNLTALLNSVQLPPYTVLIVANRTDINVLWTQINNYQVSLMEGNLLLIAAERDYGLDSEYPQNITIPDYFRELDTLYDNSILEDLELTGELLANTSQFDHFNSTVSAISNSSQVVSQLISSIKDPSLVLNQSLTLLDNISLLIDRLTQHLNDALLIQSYANETLMTVLSRNYTLLHQQLITLQNTTILSYANLSVHESLSQLHAEVSRNASNALSEYRTLLAHVVNISMSILTNVSSVDMSNELIQSNIAQIEDILQLHDVLVRDVVTNIVSTMSNINETNTVNSLTGRIIQETTDGLSSLLNLISLLHSKLTSYYNNLLSLLPQDYPLPCSTNNDTTNRTCTIGEEYSLSLQNNVTMIQKMSNYTLNYANEFLANLDNFSDEDFDAINETSHLSIDISNTVLESNIDLNEINASAITLKSNITILLLETTLLARGNYRLNNEALLQYNRSLELTEQYSELYSQTVLLQNDVMATINRSSNLTLEAREIERNATVLLHDKVTVINDTLLGVERSVRGLEDILNGVVTTVNQSREILMDTVNEINRFDSLYDTTRSLLDDTRQGLDDAMQQNIDILSEIDTLLSNIADTHSLVKKINSPANFISPSPYISLQPPPKTTTTLINNNTLLFDSIDIYLSTGAMYRPPSLLFYAGPMISSSEPDQSSLTREDFIGLTTDSPQSISLRWRVGTSEGIVTRTGSIDGFTEVYFTRVGSLFELQVVGSGVGPTRHLSPLKNNSLLFTMTERTVFLIGGSPTGSSLALPGTYNSFLGSIDLLLYNGDLWSLWDYRNRSATEFGRGFRRHDNALNNAWIPSKTPSARTNVLSFDGSGYIRAVRFYHEFQLGARDGISFHLFIKGLQGLVAYLRDPQTNVTLQLGLRDGNVILRLSGPSFATQQRTAPISDSDFSGGSTYTVLVVGEFIQFNMKGSTDVVQVSGFQFFTFLNRIEAWFGGIDRRLFTEYDPVISDSNYRGCVDVDATIGGGRIDIFSSRFVENYLSSSIQNGLSGTCLRSESTSQVSFNGSGYLSYNQLLNVPKVNENPTPSQLSGVFTFSLSFYSVSDNGVLFNAVDRGNTILVVLRSGSLNVILTSMSSGLTNTLLADVTTGRWYHLLIEIRSTNYTLFLNDIAVSSSLVPDGFFFAISGTTNLLLIGGSPNNVPFTGCIKDFTYNFQLLLLIGESLSQYIIPTGVSFNSCPYISSNSTVNSALVGVFADNPQERSCFASLPVKLADDSHIGGFHAYSTLLSYNSLPFRRSIWSFSFSWRRLSLTGHMISISSQSGVTISVSLSTGRPVLSLKGTDNITHSLPVVSPFPLPVNTWINTEVQCSISLGHLMVTMSVGDTTVGPLNVSYNNGDIFEPVLPHVIGYKEQEQVLGFVGCLRDLQINGNSTTFNQELLSSCVSCYSQPVSGWGFSGLSYIKKSLPVGANQYSVHMRFRAAREHGLLLLLTNTSNNFPILGIGLYEGQLRVTNFSLTGAFITQSNSSLCMNGERFHSLNITLTLSPIIEMRIQLDNIEMNIGSPLPTPLEGVTLYIGGLPTFGLYPPNTPYFSFLIRRDQDGLPPRFVGCINELMITSSNNELLLSSISQTDIAEEVLVGLCPSP